MAQGGVDRRQVKSSPSAAPDTPKHPQAFTFAFPHLPSSSSPPFLSPRRTNDDSTRRDSNVSRVSNLRRHKSTSMISNTQFHGLFKSVQARFQAVDRSVPAPPPSFARLKPDTR